MRDSSPGATSNTRGPTRSTARRDIRRRRRRQRRLIAGVVVLGVVLVAGAYVAFPSSSPTAAPLGVTTSPTSVASAFPTASAAVRAQIVSLAQGQLGYATDPSSTYCNRFSGYFYSGTADCGNSNRDAQWCADFAAWTWRLAGVPIVYQFINGDLNSSSASFYEWGVRHHTWHPVASGYVPQPGDVAVYGLNAKALVAQHVAVVVSFTPGARGPNAINGDGNHTGFSRVEFVRDEFNADAGAGSAPLAGYVAPNA